MIRTTGAQAILRDGNIILSIGALPDDGNKGVETVEFDIDAYALELANNLLAAVVRQKALGVGY